MRKHVIIFTSFYFVYLSNSFSLRMKDFAASNTRNTILKSQSQNISSKWGFYKGVQGRKTEAYYISDRYSYIGEMMVLIIVEAFSREFVPKYENFWGRINLSITSPLIVEWYGNVFLYVAWWVLTTKVKSGEPIEYIIPGYPIWN